MLPTPTPPNEACHVSPFSHGSPRSCRTLLGFFEPRGIGATLGAGIDTIGFGILNIGYSQV